MAIYSGLFPLKMVIFHCYVSSPEGNLKVNMRYFPYFQVTANIIMLLFKIQACLNIINRRRKNQSSQCLDDFPETSATIKMIFLFLWAASPGNLVHHHNPFSHSLGPYHENWKNMEKSPINWHHALPISRNSETISSLSLLSHENSAYLVFAKSVQITPISVWLLWFLLLLIHIKTIELQYTMVI